MRILSVGFENLNSLEGRWFIDFTHPAYRNSAIFAITGPTGSGKTTLLDAICLAIYGRTPRLKVLSKSTNELLTRQTGYCFAEVVFETVKGRFRCHWSQHRARKKPDGDLQQPRHEIIDDNDGSIIENTIKEVARKVEEVTGMNFDQFTRSILLAQGSFAAFLQAPADERSPLLEQITGTEIYSLISQRVHTATAEQQRLHQSLLDELKATALLGPEEEEDISRQLAEHRQRSGNLGEALAALQRNLGWLDSLAKLRSSIDKTEAELSHVLQQEEGERQRRKRLATAQQAATLLPLHHRLLQLRSRQLEDEYEQRRLHDERAQLEARVLENEQLLETILRQSKKLEEVFKNEQELMKTVRALDIKVKELRLRRQKEVEEAEELDNQQKQCEKRLLTLQEALQKASSQKERCLQYFKNHRSDAGLDRTLPTLAERADMLLRNRNKSKALQQRLEENGAARRTTEARLQAATKARDQAAARSAQRQQQYKDVENAIARLKDQYPNLRALVEQASERLQLLERLAAASANHQAIVDENSDLLREHRDSTARLKRAEEETKILADSVASQWKIVRQQEELHLLSRRLESYDEERRRLEQGRPCPLCGSTTHPFADTLPVAADDSRKTLEEERQNLAELQKRADAVKEEAALLRGRLSEYDKQRSRLEKRISSAADLVEQLRQTAGILRNEHIDEDAAEAQSEAASHLELLRQKTLKLEELEKEERSIRSSLATLEKEERTYEEEIATLRFKREALRDTGRDLEEQLGEVGREIERQVKILGDDLASFGYDFGDDGELHDILDALTRRQRQWQEQLDLEKQLNKQIQNDEKEYEAARSLCQRLQSDCVKQQQEAARIDSEYQQHLAERQRLYGEKDPDAEEKLLRDQAEEKRQQQKATEERLNSSRSAVTLLDDRSKRLEDAIARRAEELDSAAGKWRQRLAASGFSNDEDFGAALLPENRIDELVNRFEALASRKMRLSAILEEQRHTLHTEQQKQLTEASAEELTAEVEQATKEQQHHLQQIGRLEGTLEENRKTADKQKAKRQQLAQQKKELGRWQRLDDLIGSANGKKFRNFAQGITFEIMVRQANGALRMMTDRYLLIRDTAHPLELNIIDNYRAGDIRSTKNLSGGESFLVSLALALGLSKMASNAVRVDSLFLDEGFGTLDEETLETALQMLAGLRHEGRMIGIISHVSLLKERLETRIQVIPGRGGHSLLRGPGIESL